MKLIINIKPEAKLSRIEQLVEDLNDLSYDGDDRPISGIPYDDVIESITCDKAVN